ncbi:hypothetical protein [Nocardia sp. NPDC004860]|uniref:hypothetical protein n=1 Tax=Nocardia sp. NPDC004860 TaxID=3154557 RepID=UPI0033A36AAF
MGGTTQCHPINCVQVPWGRHGRHLVVLHDLPTGAMRHLPAFLDELDARSVEVATMPIYRGVQRAHLTHLGAG